MDRKLLALSAFAASALVVVIWLGTRSTAPVDKGVTAPSPNSADSLAQNPPWSQTLSAKVSAHLGEGRYRSDLPVSDRQEIAVVAAAGLETYLKDIPPQSILNHLVSQGWQVDDDWESDPGSAAARWSKWSRRVVLDPSALDALEVRRVIDDGAPTPESMGIAQSMQSFNNAYGGLVAAGKLRGADVYEVRVPIEVDMNGESSSGMFGVQVAPLGPGGKWVQIGVSLTEMSAEVRLTQPPPLR